MFTYKIKSSQDSRIITIDNLNENELNNIHSNEYINKFDNLIVERSDNKIVEYIKINGLYIVSNKINKGMR